MLKPLRSLVLIATLFATGCVAHAEVAEPVLVPASYVYTPLY